MVFYFGTIYCLVGGVGRNIVYNLVLLGCDVYLFLVIGDDFYGEMFLEEMCCVGVNVFGCVCLYG